MAVLLSRCSYDMFSSLPFLDFISANALKFLPPITNSVSCSAFFQGSCSCFCSSHLNTSAVFKLPGLCKVTSFILHLSPGKERATEQFCGWNIILLLISLLVQDWCSCQMKRYIFNLIYYVKVCRIAAVGLCWPCLGCVVPLLTLFEYCVIRITKSISSCFCGEQGMYLKMGESDLHPNAL